MAFIVINGEIISSIIYKVFIDGSAIKISRNAGIDVQKISVWCDSKRNRLNALIFMDLTNIDIVSRVILAIRIIVWSWKNDKCSIRGEFLFCIPIEFHIGIVYSFRWLVKCMV